MSLDSPNGFVQAAVDRIEALRVAGIGEDDGRTDCSDLIWRPRIGAHRKRCQWEQVDDPVSVFEPNQLLSLGERVHVTEMVVSSDVDRCRTSGCGPRGIDDLPQCALLRWHAVRIQTKGIGISEKVG